jgi:hypothetical protein
MLLSGITTSILHWAKYRRAHIKKMSDCPMNHACLWDSALTESIISMGLFVALAERIKQSQ